MKKKLFIAWLAWTATGPAVAAADAGASPSSRAAHAPKKGDTAKGDAAPEDEASRTDDPSEDSGAPRDSGEPQENDEPDVKAPPRTPIPDIDEWIATVKTKPREKQEFKYPERILIIRDPQAKKGAIFPRLSPKVFNQLGMFEIPDYRQVVLQFQLNQRPHETRWIERSSEDLVSSSMPILFDTFDVDLIVAIPAAGPWEVFDASNEKPLIIDENPPRDKISAGNINTWLNDRVGYDAYVVDQRGKYVLLKSQAKLMKQGLQALVLKNSNDDFILKGKKTKGSAILQAVAARRQYGLYKLVLSEDNVEQLVPGTKIILEHPRP